MRISATVNGSRLELEATPTSALLDVLRDAGLTGTKEGCRVGVCGLCTVLVGDRPVSSCLMLAPCVDGEEVWTIEGIAARYPQVVAAFVDAEAMQCGICTPGQVMIAVAARGRVDPNDEAAVRRYLEGNLCRCTGYQTIVNAVRRCLAQ
jgi:aerobic-type carbon monoxide dehydrogenase small subunit (CoxS/CutS family)